MSEHLERTAHIADAAALKAAGIGAGGVGIGVVNYMELAQNALVSAGSVCGAILVIWTLCDKIRLTYKKSRRETDVRKEDKVDG